MVHNSQASYFFYSQAGQLMYEYNATAAQPTDYLYLNGKLIARYMSGQNPTDLLTDRLGTPVREIDSTGAVAQSFSYRPFGQLYSGPSQQQPGYTGHVLDPESNLNYMQARYQDGGLGQFLSVDPMTPVPGNVLGFNRYSYAGNNPISNIDPDGRESACVTMKSGCGGDNPAAKAAGTAVANVLLGFAKSVANAASNAMILIAPQEGQPLQASNSQQAIGMAAGSIVTGAAEATVTEDRSVIANPIPDVFARVIPGDLNPSMLGHP